MAQRTLATLIGFVAILLWSLLALFTAASGQMPPFQLVAVSFAIGGVIGLVPLLRTPGGLKTLSQPLHVWLLGTGGLFGYHLFYFMALRNAPAIEASLINYLWPLLIIVFSAALPGERLGWHHMLGGALGLVGAFFIVTGGKGFAFEGAYLFGYGVALLAAFIWSSYSVASRRFASVPTTAVTGFLFVAAALAALCHMFFEQTVWPETPLQWAATIGLGLGPAGGAFYFWDRGVKKGDIQVLGAASYAAPLLSTLILIAFGVGSYTNMIGIACLLITLGAVLAAKDMLIRRKPA